MFTQSDALKAPKPKSNSQYSSLLLQMLGLPLFQHWYYGSEQALLPVQLLVNRLLCMFKWY